VHTYHYRPYHGIFVYGPRPTHHHYYSTTSGAQPVQQKHMPTRKVDRAGTLAVGVRSGSYLGAYEGSEGYGDFGLGLTARYRPEEAFGLELAVSKHDETWGTGTERSQMVSSASAQLFATPWSRVSPFLTGGLTMNNRSVDETYFDSQGMQTYEGNDTVWGPHVGLGIEFGIGQNVALDFEARAIGYVNNGPDDPTVPGAVQTSGGLLVHF
jgi:opacity protein-like surface antigen